MCYFQELHAIFMWWLGCLLLALLALSYCPMFRKRRQRQNSPPLAPCSPEIVNTTPEKSLECPNSPPLVLCSPEIISTTPKKSLECPNSPPLVLCSPEIISTTPKKSLEPPNSPPLVPCSPKISPEIISTMPKKSWERPISPPLALCTPKIICRTPMKGRERPISPPLASHSPKIITTMPKKSREHPISSPLVSCSPEIISTTSMWEIPTSPWRLIIMPPEELEKKVKVLLVGLKTGHIAQDYREDIYMHIKRVMCDREDAACLLMKEVMSVVVKDIMEAERESHKDIKLYNFTLLYEMVGIFINQKTYEDPGSGICTLTEVYRRMKKFLSSSYLHEKRVVTTFMAEILANAMELSNEEHRFLMAKMIDLLGENDPTILSSALDCIQHLLQQNPKVAAEFKNELTKALTKQIGPHKPFIITKMIDTALAAIDLFKRKFKSEVLKELLKKVAKHVGDGPKTQLSAIKLVDAVVQKFTSCLCSSIADVLSEHLTLLLLKVHSRDPEVSSSAETAILHCLRHLLRWHPLALLCWRRQYRAAKTKEERLDCLYSLLQRNNLLKPALLLCVELLSHIEDTDALVKYVSQLRDRISYSDVLPTELRRLYMGLHTSRLDKLTARRAQFVIDVLKEKWCSLGTPCQLGTKDGECWW